MMLFAYKGKKELKKILFELKMNLENNYKDSAHEARKRLGARSEELFAEKKIDEKTYLRYKRIYEEYTEKMKDYHH